MKYNILVSHWKRKARRQGFSLVEILIFVTIFSLFFVAAASVMVVSLRNISTSEHRILATRFAQELEEWLRGEREADFDAFALRADQDNDGIAETGETKTYCFNGSLSWPAAGACAGFTGVTNAGGYPLIFKRQVALTYQADQVKVDITASWQEGAKVLSVPISTILTIAQ